MSPESHQLAIVIPAYKAAFLRNTLDSIARQTDQRFRVYVGDDASPEPIGDIVRHWGFEGSRLVYRRFEDNLGSTSLVRQWDRCIALGQEPWIWLFSDDDEMEPDCVAAFYRTFQETKAGYDAYRYNVSIIDRGGQVASLNPPHPVWESAMQYAYFRLNGLRASTAQEVVFSRRAYERMGGFPDFPLAWAADIAGLIHLAQANGIRLIDGPKIRFRTAGQNISSGRDHEQRGLKLRAAMLFVQWFEDFLKTHPDPSFPLSGETLKAQSKAWFMRTLDGLDMLYGPMVSARLGQFITDRWGGARWRNLLRVVKRNCTVLQRRL